MKRTFSRLAVAALVAGWLCLRTGQRRAADRDAVAGI